MKRGGSSNDRLRRFNLSTILTMIHHSSGCSRAELTRRTGLNRSTISALVAELVELGLAFEGEPEDVPGRVGRPSLQVFPSPRVAAIAVSPDVDAITVGLVGLGGEVIRRIRFDTARVPTVVETVNAVKAIVAGMRGEIEKDCEIAGVGVAVPGLVDTADGRVLIAPHLGWRDSALTTSLARALDYPVFAGNDASLGAIAESLFGAARGVADLVYLNGSASGIGGGLIIGGSPLRGTSGYAGELGHTLVNSAGVRCHCGRIGCLETEVSMQRLREVLGLPRVDEDGLDIALGVSRDLSVGGDLEFREHVRPGNGRARWVPRVAALGRSGATGRGRAGEFHRKPGPHGSAGACPAALPADDGRGGRARLRRPARRPGRLGASAEVADVPPGPA
jgi:hypothetical protein